MKFTVTERYTRCYENPLKLNFGETLKDLRQETNPEWPNWFFCRTQSGNEGWVSTRYISIDGEIATVKANYDAIELNAAENEIVEALRNEDGWSWCRKSDGAEGWLPNDILRIFQNK